MEASVMVEAPINSSNTNPNLLLDPDLDPSSSNGSSSLFHRRIEFHLARKPFAGFSNGSGGFQLETLNPNTCSSTMAGNKPDGSNTSGPPGKKVDGSDLLENGLDPELSFRITFKRIGAGLANLGNTCFLNSVIQCLTYTEPLAAYLQSGKHQTSCRTAGFCALCAIQKHVSRALQATGRILAPKDLVSNLRCISRNFRNARQEDAHEYMVNLLESMHKCCLPSGVHSDSPGAYEKSLVHKIFGGRLRSQVKCMQCSFCSNKFDPFLDLSLEIVKADSMYKALSHFTAKEQLDGGEKQYQCQQCKQKVKALKQLTVYKAPYVLTIHLKRFGSYERGQKIDKKVQFGPTLDLKPFVTGPYDGDLTYTLYGVLVHAGWSTHSGHYYCFVRTSSGMWYSLDDNEVVQVSEKVVLEQKAYMLFYVRDRRNFPSKKAIEFVQKERIAMNATGNKLFPNFNQGLKKTMPNNLVEERLSSDSSAAVAQIVASDTDASKVIQKKEASSLKVNGMLPAECSSVDKNPPAEPLSIVSRLQDSVKGGPPVHNMNGEECLQQSASSAKGSERSPKRDDSVSTTGARNVESNFGGNTEKDLSHSFVVPSNCNGPLNSIANKDLSGSITLPSNCNENKNAKKDLRDSVVMPRNYTSTDGSSGDMSVAEKSVRKDSSEKSLEKINPASSFSQTSCKDGQQVEVLSKESAVGDLASERLEESLHGNNMDHNPRLKPKKKILKSRTACLRLGSNILLRISLTQHKKKKHKKSKQHNLGIKNLNQGNLLDIDLMPSTSEKPNTGLLCGSAQSKKDNGVSLRNVTNPGSSLSMDTMDKEFRERVTENGSLLATDKQSQKNFSSSSVRNQWEDEGPNASKHGRRDAVQNGLMCMLTRGLEETIVARWDDLQLPPSSDITDSRAMEGATIGYVADEWDEEYDRGKRKKVRASKINFDGPNLFQEVATKRAKQNKGKMDRSRSGNQPFRI